LPCVLFALAGLAGTATAATTTSSATPQATYRLIRLAPTSAVVAGPVINNKGQAAFSVSVPSGLTLAKFYDGRSFHNIGTFGGPSTTVRDLNDRGQVTGFSSLNAEPTLVHAFRWSLATGLVDINPPSVRASRASAINNKGQVAGSADFASGLHAFSWSPRTGMIDIGTLGGLNSLAFANNDAGVVVGASEGPSNARSSLVAFRWTQAEGIRDIGTFPSEFTGANYVNAAGYIVGATPFMPDSAVAHAFVWRPRAGLLDLGVGTGGRSEATKINDKGEVIGYTSFFGGVSHGFIWRHDTGFFEIGAASPTLQTSADDINNRGQVVGRYGDHAYAWTRAGGFVDLSTRIAGVPTGFKLVSASAIADNGTIVANANDGFVYLLVQSCGCSHDESDTNGK
jgi:probable HAF family extracellular repeat protein